MEFDKTRVYTAVNAEELPIGSKCIFADTIVELKEAVAENCNIETLADVYSEYEEYRFKPTNSGRSVYSLAYLIELPKEKQQEKSFLDAIKGKWTICKYMTKELMCENISDLEEYIFDSYEDADNYMADMVLEGEWVKGTIEQITGSIEEREVITKKLFLAEE